MSGRLAVIVIAAAVAGAAATTQQPPPANLIWVAGNVIHQDGHLVTKLSAADFAVADNGAPREIVSFRNDRIPIAVAIMVDISHSMEPNYGLVRRAVDALTSRFEPGDRAIVGSFDALPWIADRFSARPDVIRAMLSAALSGTANAAPLALCDGDWIDRTAPSRFGQRSGFGPTTEFSRRLAIHGGSAIWDGASCGINAVASDGETPRRIVVLITDAVDSMSFSSPASVIGRANQYGVMVYGVAMMGGYGMAGGDLKGLAERTGGGYFYLTGEDQVADAFTRVGDELRHQYVLGFAANGALDRVRDVAVTSRAPSTTARFRRVMMDMSSAPMAPAAAAATALRAVASPSPALPSTMVVPDRAAPSDALPKAPASDAPRTPLWDTLDQFTQRDWPVGQAPRRSIAELRSMLSLLRRDGSAWIGAAAEPDRGRRRLAAAAFVLDLLYTQNDPYLWLPNQPNPDLIDWGVRTLREGPATPEERLWYFGAIALLERGGAPESLDRIATRALERFPDEGRFVLARAVAQDLRTWPEDRDVRAFTIASQTTAALVSRYEDATAHPSVRDEALLRLGYFEFRRGRITEALARFDAVDRNALPDPVLRFWFHLLNGRALEQADRLPDAIASYQSALDDVPAATSARSALIAALARARQSSSAARLAAQTLSSASADVDPWTMYVLPDMRFWPAITTALREAVTR
ncbi:MAG TPA: VWA domain-containing protein [Vicinamibacterales bacterium]|nr:VWA domain-containing protein [Vicinamibacterales bacterium]